MANEKTNPRRARTPLVLGVFCIAAAILASRGLIEKHLSPDGVITSFRTLALIHGSRIALAGLGLGLILWRPRIRLANLALAAISSGGALLVAELLMQVFYHPAPIRSGWRSGDLLAVSGLEKNQFGFRGWPLGNEDGETIVVLLGDSQVEAVECAYRWMPERRLEHYMQERGKPVRVVTLGARGWGTDQQLLALREYYQGHRADLVVLWMTLGNDVWNNVFPTSMPANGLPKPTYWLEGGELRGPSEELGGSAIETRIKLLELFHRLYTVRHRDEQWERRLPPPHRPLEEYDGEFGLAWEQGLKFNPLLAIENMETEKNHRAIWLAPRSERMQYGIDLTRKLLREIERLTRANDGELVLFHVITPPIASAGEKVYRLGDKYYYNSKKQLEANSAALLQGFNHLAIDVTMENWRFSPANTHLNEHAVDDAMRSLAEQVAKYTPDGPPAR